MGKSAEKFSKQDQTMKSLVRLLKLQALLMALGIMGGWARAGDPACLLNLPLPPHSEADGFVRLTYGSPAGAGVSPEFSLFTVDILPPGGREEVQPRRFPRDATRHGVLTWRRTLTRAGPERRSGVRPFELQSEFEQLPA